MRYDTMFAKAGDQVIGAIETIEGLGVQAASAIGGTIGSALPKFPQIPYVSQLPHPRTVVDTYFDLAEKWVTSQRRYFRDLVEAYAPVTEKLMPEAKPSRTPASTSTKPATKPAAKRNARRRTTAKRAA